MKGCGRDCSKLVVREGLSVDGMSEHRSGEGGPFTEGSEEFSVEEGSAGQRS